MGFASALSCNAQLTWGVNGSGGTGTWDSTTLDWYDGTTNTKWVSGDVATFAGTGGNVSVLDGEEVSGVTISVPGYTITGGTLGASSALTIDVDANATLENELQIPGTFTKSGNGTLSLTSPVYQSSSGATVNITGGALQVANSESVSSTAVYNLSNTPGVALILGGPLGGIGSTFTMSGISGGGAAGGNVTVSPATGTTTLEVANATATNSYGGILQDNGAGKLALTVAGAQTLTGASTYSGPTVVTDVLTLSGNGSLLNTSISGPGVLVLDNTTTNLSNRLSDTTPFPMEGGTLVFDGQASSASTETIGALQLVVASSIIEVNAGSSGTAVVTFNGVTRSAEAGAVNFTGTGFSQIIGASNTNGILGAYAVDNGTDWAALNGQNEVVPYTNYVTDLASAVAASNVKLTGGGATTLAASATINSLNIQNSASSAATLDLGGNTLDLASGGALITSTSNSVTIQNGNLTSSGGEVIVTNNPLNFPAVETINANITDSSGPVSLTKAGSGYLYVGGVNTYSGSTNVQGGELVVNTAAALPSGSPITMTGNAALNLVNGGAFASLSGSGNIGSTTGTMTVNTTTDTLYAGDISGAGRLILAGTGTLELTGASSNGVSYTGTIQISGGVLLLHEGEVSAGRALFSGDPPVSLSGGTVAIDPPVVGDITQNLGALSVQSDSTINFNNDNQMTGNRLNLEFADSSAASWGSAKLYIENFNTSVDKLGFGEPSANGISYVGLTPAQLAQIVFTNYGNAPGQIDSKGNVTPALPIATITLGNLSASYNGSPQSVTATTNPPGLTVAFTYNGSAAPPTNIGSYPVVATVQSQDYQGTATGTLVISKGTPTINLGNLAATYDGKAQPVTATTVPAGVDVTLTYDGKATVPIAAGSYTVIATVNTADYSGTATNTLVIGPAAATVTLGDLTALYNVRPHAATAITVPPGLAVTFTYDGSSSQPVLVGNYFVTGTVSNPDYTGGASGTLTILPVVPLVTTSVATLISATSATLGGSTYSKGANTTVSFQYFTNGTAGGYANAAQTASQNVPGSVTDVIFTAPLSGLTPATIYHYRAVATNAAGTVNGLDKTFTTLAKPIFNPTPATPQLSASGAQVGFSVNPNGVATSVYFIYSTDSSFGTFSQSATQSLGSGKTAINVLGFLGELQPNQLYYYEMVTVSAAGTFYSNEESFTTLGFDTTLVAKTGDFAVGSSGPAFASFGNPAVNDSDDVAFAATLNTGTATGITSANDFGIWTDVSGTRKLIAQVGGTAPITNNNVFDGDSTSLTGISGNNAVGSYYPIAASAHAFIYNVSTGSFTALEPPGSISAQALAVSGINVAGLYTLDNNSTAAFLYNGRTYTTINPPSGEITPTGISGTTVVGYYVDGQNVTHGFLFSGSTLTTIDPPGTTATEALGISGGTVVGYLTNSSAAKQGFLYKAGNYTTLDPPGSENSVATAVDGLNVVGYYTDNGRVHGFLYNGSTYTTIDPPGSIQTNPEAISGGNVVGSYSNGSDNLYGFLFDGTTYTTIEPPGGSDAVPTGVSGKIIVGNFSDDLIGYGFIDNNGTYTTIQPPSGNATFLTLGDPVSNNGGDVAFQSTFKLPVPQATTTSGTGIWLITERDTLLVAQQGSAAPGTDGGTFDTFISFALADEIFGNGNMLVYATLNPSTSPSVTSANNAGIWEGFNAAGLNLLLRLGQGVGGKTISALSFLPKETFVDGQTRSFNSTTGDIVAGATFSDKSTGLVTVIGGTPAIAYLSGSTATGVSAATFASFGNPAINTHNKLAFGATLAGVASSANAGIWAENSGGTLGLIAQSGATAAPGTTAAFVSFSDPVDNNNEAVAFRATLKVATSQASSTTATGIWCNSTGPLALVARQGGQAPGCATGATFAAFDGLALADQGGATNNGGTILLATLNASTTAGVTTTNNLGIWAVDNSGTLQLIVRTGDVLNGKTVTGLSFLPAETLVNGQTRSFSPSTGDLVFNATFSDKSQAIFNVVFP